MLPAQSRTLGDDHPDTLRTRHMLARAKLRLGNPADAEQIYGQVLHGRRQTLGDDHPDTIKTRYGLTQAMDEAGRPAEAERQNRDRSARSARGGGADTAT
jgi:hypothetical protein